MQEKRRKAPGWLDSESKLLQPEKKQEVRSQGNNDGVDLLNQPEADADRKKSQEQTRTADELGDAMDRAFGGTKTH